MNKGKKAQPEKDSFESVAKRLECDPNMAAFDKKLGKLARVRPSPKLKK